MEIYYYGSNTIKIVISFEIVNQLLGVYHKEVMKQKQKEMKAVTKEIGPKCSKTRYKITRIP